MKVNFVLYIMQQCDDRLQPVQPPLVTFQTFMGLQTQIVNDVKHPHHHLGIDECILGILQRVAIGIQIGIGFETPIGQNTITLAAADKSEGGAWGLGWGGEKVWTDWRGVRVLSVM